MVELMLSGGESVSHYMEDDKDGEQDKINDQLFGFWHWLKLLQLHSDISDKLRYYRPLVFAPVPLTVVGDGWISRDVEENDYKNSSIHAYAYK